MDGYSLFGVKNRVQPKHLYLQCMSFKMFSLVHLPPETLIRIFLQLSVDDCLNFAKTCKVINKASDIELLWVKKIRQDFGISANIYSGKYSSHSARNFYRHILYKYGKLLGLWQVTTYGPSGGLLQVGIGC